jgi:hypothetical protein
MADRDNKLQGPLTPIPRMEGYLHLFYQIPLQLHICRYRCSKSPVHLFSIFFASDSTDLQWSGVLNYLQKVPS